MHHATFLVGNGVGVGSIMLMHRIVIQQIGQEVADYIINLYANLDLIKSLSFISGKSRLEAQERLLEKVIHDLKSWSQEIDSTENLEIVSWNIKWLEDFLGNLRFS